MNNTIGENKNVAIEYTNKYMQKAHE